MLTVTAVNDPPVLQRPRSEPVVAVEDSVTLIPDIRVVDVDSLSARLSLVVNVSHGFVSCTLRHLLRCIVRHAVFCVLVSVTLHTCPHHPPCPLPRPLSHVLSAHLCLFPCASVPGLHGRVLPCHSVP